MCLFFSCSREKEALNRLEEEQRKQHGEEQRKRAETARRAKEAAERKRLEEEHSRQGEAARKAREAAERKAREREKQQSGSVVTRENLQDMSDADQKRFVEALKKMMENDGGGGTSEFARTYTNALRVRVQIDETLVKLAVADC